MDLDRQIAIASKLMYFIGLVSIVHWLTNGSLMVTWVLGSGATDLGSAYVLQGRPFTGYTFEFAGVAAFFLAGFGISRRYAGMFLRALALLVVDALLLFDRVSADGIQAGSIGLFASFLVVFHAIVLWYVWRATWALRQERVNANIIRRLRFETELKRRLAESDEPPPPAAKFDTRFAVFHQRGRNSRLWEPPKVSAAADRSR